MLFFPEAVFLAPLIVNFRIIGNLMLFFILIFFDINKVILENSNVNNNYLNILFIYLFFVCHIFTKGKLNKFYLPDGIQEMYGRKSSTIYLFLENSTIYIGYIFIFLFIKSSFSGKGIIFLILFILDFIFNIHIYYKKTLNVLKYEKISFLLITLLLFGFYVNDFQTTNNYKVFFVLFNIAAIGMFFMIKSSRKKNLELIIISVTTIGLKMIVIFNKSVIIDSLSFSLALLSFCLLLIKKKHSRELSIERHGYFLFYLKQILNEKEQLKIFSNDYLNLLKRTSLFLIFPLIISLTNINSYTIPVIILWYITDLNLECLILLFNRKLLKKHELKNIDTISDFGISSIILLSITFFFIFNKITFDFLIVPFIILLVNILILYLLKIWSESFFRDIYLK